MCVASPSPGVFGNDSARLSMEHNKLFTKNIISNMIGYGTMFCKLRKCLAKHIFLGFENFAIYKCLCSGHNNNNSSEKARCGREKVFFSGPEKKTFLLLCATHLKPFAELV